MIKWLLIKMGFRPTNEELRILKLLEKPWNRTARVVGRGTLIKDPDPELTPARIAWRLRMAQKIRDADERIAKEKQERK